MRDFNLHVKSSGKGPPQVLIPNQYRWDFLEYLALKRVHVIYTHYDEHFMVTFLTMNCAGAQGLLDDWVACAARSQPAALCGL